MRIVCITSFAVEDCFFINTVSPGMCRQASRTRRTHLIHRTQEETCQQKRVPKQIQKHRVVGRGTSRFQASASTRREAAGKNPPAVMVARQSRGKNPERNRSRWAARAQSRLSPNRRVRGNGIVLARPGKQLSERGRSASREALPLQPMKTRPEGIFRRRANISSLDPPSLARCIAIPPGRTAESQSCPN
jgi:hypothetical protein